jgi:hypothetical protein
MSKLGLNSKIVIVGSSRDSSDGELKSADSDEGNVQ